MKKKLAAWAGGIYILAASFFLLANSGGPSIDATGSPFDSNMNACTQCHTSFGLNSGTGSISLTGVTDYYPGTTYNLTMTVSQPSPIPARYGFQTIALTSGNAAAGTFTTGTGTKLQTIGGRQYIEHNSMFNNTGVWNFSWTAPNTNQGTLTFYFGGAAADGTGGNSGDYIYSSTLNVNVIPPMTYTTAALNPICNGDSTGTASINVSGGGIAPYSYLWNTGDTTNSISSLPAGSYTITVTDSDGNQEVETIVLTEPAEVSGTFSTIDATCAQADGEATVIPSGGNPGYSYLWNDPNGQTTQTASGLVSGIYLVTITDTTGCTGVDTVTVDVGLSGLTATISTVGENCGSQDGEATIVMNSGLSPFLYNWSNGDQTATADSLGAGTHDVTVTDANGCTDVFTAGVVDVAAPMIQETITDNVCHGDSSGSITLEVTNGIPPYTFDWMGQQTSNDSTAINLVAGSYSVEVTDDAGCTALLNYSIAELNTPIELDTFIMVGTFINTCEGSLDITISGGVPPYTYLWNDPDAQTTAMAIDLCTGFYDVTVTDSLGCVVVFDSMYVEWASGIGESVAGVQARVWPNPTNGSLTLELDEAISETIQLHIIDVVGRKISTQTIQSNSPIHSIDMNGLTNGLYFISIEVEGRIVNTLPVQLRN